MKRKVLALLLIGFIYVAAFASGVATILSLMRIETSPALDMLLAMIVATVVIYVFSCILDNASIYDPFWSVAPIFMVAVYYFCYKKAFDPHHLIVLIPFLLWSIRLTANWILSFEGMNWQDWRYKLLKQKHPKCYQLICFCGIMLMPSLLVFAGSVPLGFFIDSQRLSPFHVVGALIISAAVCYQAIADWQLRKFRKNSVEGACINSGLWQFSRHPNYFGELTVWWGVAISALGGNTYISAGLSSDYFFYFLASLVGAVLITLLFVFISVPLMEGHVLAKKPIYAEYKKSVRSPLVPLFWKKSGGKH